MKNLYEKPTIIVDTDFSEGVYMASGSCYVASGYITQRPETGRGNYCIQINGRHDSTGSDRHTNDAQTITVTFNQNVTHSSGGRLQSGNGTTTLVLAYTYHNNATDNIGLGDLYVESSAGLSVISVTISDGH